MALTILRQGEQLAAKMPTTVENCHVNGIKPLASIPETVDTALPSMITLPWPILSSAPLRILAPCPKTKHPGSEKRKKSSRSE